VFTGRRREKRLSVHVENKGEDEKIRERGLEDKGENVHIIDPYVIFSANHSTELGCPWIVCFACFLRTVDWIRSDG
jgi:hypothetical protein